MLEALRFYNRRQRMRELLQYAGKCDGFFAPAELQRLRAEQPAS